MRERQRPIRICDPASEQNSDLSHDLLFPQIHMEAAKCEEDEDQLGSAILHLNKALSLDDAGIYRERIETTREKMKLRGELYKNPKRLEEQAGMIIEQV